MKGLHSRVFANLFKGGIAADSEQYVSGSTPKTLRLDAYEARVATGGTQGNEEIDLPFAGAKVGQRKLVTYLAEGHASDVLRIRAVSGAQLATEGFEFSAVSGYAQTVHTNCDLAAPGDFALFEFKGGSTPTWNLLYSKGATLS